jgi:hypothetical protein
MSKELQVKSTVMDLTEFRKLLGSPPVLSTENTETYEGMINGFMRSLVPRDFVEQILIGHLNDATWEIQRYQRHKSLSIERKYLEYFAYNEKRKKEIADRKTSLANAQVEAAETTSEIERLRLLEDVVDAEVSEVRRIAGRRPEDLDVARALEASMESQEGIDRLLNAAYGRRREALEQLEIYRNGLGQHPKYVQPEIIEGDFEEANASVKVQQVPLVPKLEGQSE